LYVRPIAHTLIDWDELSNVTAGTVFGSESRREIEVTDADHLAEFAGRACYKAYDRTNPATAQTAGYLNNILTQQHYSVLEHSSVSFFVAGVSRSMLLELERHRFLSFSAESQRYVDQSVSHPEPVVPSLFVGTSLDGMLRTNYRTATENYLYAVGVLQERGHTLKEARGAARAFLPEATPVEFVVTGNIRCWRDVLGKRYSTVADAEIRQFASLVLAHLRELAPASVQDFPEVPFNG
jgi:thymidylate synthase (FAD)